MKKQDTEQDEFWKGKFGKDYVARNSVKRLLKNNISLFSKIF